MGRKNSNAKGGGQQHRRSKGGPENHHPYSVFGETRGVVPQRILPLVNVTPKFTPPRPDIHRTPLPADIFAVRDFILKSKGQSKLNFRAGHRFGVVTADLMDEIRSRFQESTAKLLIEEFLKTHQDPIPYVVEDLFSRPSDDKTVLMRAVPTQATKDALNQDILDAQTVFGIEETFRHSALIIAKYPDMKSSRDAEAMLTERLQAQGGVLLTFGGVQLPSTAS